MSYEFDLAKRAFQEHMARVGVPITGGCGNTKQCVTGSIERKRSQQIVAMLGEAATAVDMLAEDFDALALVANQSRVTIDSIVFTVLSVVRDPVDPCVHFLVVADH